MTQAQQQEQRKNPPASHKIINNMPMVTVTADDLLEVTNKECLICLDEQVIIIIIEYQYL